MKQKLKTLHTAFGQNSMLKNSAALISGTVAAQAIVFLFSPVLSRLFGLAEFGDLANYNAWVAILALLSGLRYEQAVIVAKGRKNTNSVIALTAALSFLSFLACAAVALLLHAFYQGDGYLYDLQRIVLFIPVGVLAVCISSLFVQFNVKTGHFKRLAIVATIQVVFTVLPQIVLGILHVRNALIVGTIVGYAFAGCLFGWMFFKSHRLAEFSSVVSWRRLRSTAVEHVNFPRYMMPGDGLGIIVQQFVPVFVLALFNPAVAGLYSFSIRVVRLPLIVVSTAVGGALRKEAIDRVHAGESLAGLFFGTVKSLFILALVPFMIALFFGVQIFSAVFGHQWAEAGRVVQILSPGILFEFVALPLSAFFLVTSTQRYTFAIQLTGFVLLVSALFLGRHFLTSFPATCFLISGVMIVINVATVVLAGKVAGVVRPQIPLRIPPANGMNP
jgi:O-antigen/teichoic acid export membrane protein